jgi:hypothetical protein
MKKSSDKRPSRFQRGRQHAYGSGRAILLPSACSLFPCLELEGKSEPRTPNQTLGTVLMVFRMRETIW